MVLRVKQALTTWIDSSQQNWTDGLDLVQFAVRTTPRASTGLTPFFCVHGREAILPHDAFMDGGEREYDLHRDIENRIDMMAKAQEAVDAAFDRRRQNVERANQAINRHMHVAVGDYVLISTAPVKGRSAKLDNKFSGPWQVMSPNGESGLSFTCRMMGRKVRRTSAHVENMKPFHLRPEQLHTNSVHTPLTPEQLASLSDSDQLFNIIDRRAEPNDTWSYKWRARDGTTSQWVTETEMLETLHVLPWTLDTFHALYEMRHRGRIPQHAVRPAPAADAALRKTDALTRFPRGTAVVREARGLDNTYTYIWGAVRNFYSPYWRVRYEDDEWEDLTSSQLKDAMRLAQAVQNRATRKAQLQGDDAPAPYKPAISLVLAPSMPNDFGERYVGEVVRYLWPSTGWCRGVLQRFYPLRGEYTFDILFNGETNPKVVKLRAGYYTASRDGKGCVSSSWNLLLEQEPLLTAEAADADARADAPSTGHVTAAATADSAQPAVSVTNTSNKRRVQEEVAGSRRKRHRRFTRAGSTAAAVVDSTSSSERKRR
jgi:hypothetical protein